MQTLVYIISKSLKTALLDKNNYLLGIFFAKINFNFAINFEICTWKNNKKNYKEHNSVILKYTDLSNRHFKFISRTFFRELKAKWPKMEFRSSICSQKSFLGHFC